MSRILVVDDEQDICAIIKYNLQKAGHEVDVAYSAEEALTLDIPSYQAILLDVMMGEMSGLQMLSVLRNNPETASVPVILVTAKTAEGDIVEGLDSGADDYISKPFSVNELVSRVSALLRRTSSAAAGTTAAQSAAKMLSFEGLSMDLFTKKVTVDGNEVSLTKTEYSILELFLSSPGVIRSRDDIIRFAWPKDVVVLDRTVDVNIARLRKKIEPYGDCLATRHGYGYILLPSSSK